MKKLTLPLTKAMKEAFAHSAPGSQKVGRSRRLPKKDVLKAARSMRRTTPHVESGPHEVSEPVPTLADVCAALLRDLRDEDHGECNHEGGHCQFSEAFGLLHTMPEPQAVLTASELDDVEGTLTAAKGLLEKLDSTMQGGGARAVDSHSPLDRVLHGIFRGLMLMKVGRVRLGVTP